MEYNKIFMGFKKKQCLKHFIVFEFENNKMHYLS